MDWRCPGFDRLHLVQVRRIIEREHRPHELGVGHRVANAKQTPFSDHSLQLLILRNSTLKSRMVFAVRLFCSEASWRFSCFRESLARFKGKLMCRTSSLRLGRPLRGVFAYVDPTPLAGHPTCAGNGCVFF